MIPWGPPFGCLGTFVKTSVAVFGEPASCPPPPPVMMAGSLVESDTTPHSKWSDLPKAGGRRPAEAGHSHGLTRAAEGLSVPPASCVIQVQVLHYSLPQFPHL